MATKRYEDIDADPVLLHEVREKNGVPDSVAEDATRTIVGIPEPESAEAQVFISAVAKQLGVSEQDGAENGNSENDPTAPAATT